MYKSPNGAVFARGGGEVCIHNIGKSLALMGFDSVVLAISEFDEQSAEEKIDGVLYRRVKVKSKTSFSMLKYLIEAVSISRNFDAVFVNQFTPHLVLPFLKAKNKVAIIHDVYSLEGLKFWISQFGFFRGGIGYFVEKLQLIFDKKYASKIMIVSEFSAGKVVKALGESIRDKIVVNPYPLEIDSVKSNATRENFMLFMGRFVKYKHPEHVLFALSRIKAVYGDFKAVFIVPRVEKNCMRIFKKWQRELGLSDDDVILKFGCDSSEVAGLLGRAKLFTHPSVVEGQGIAILEALQVGCSVVAYDLPVYKGMLVNGENSMLTPADDYEKFADACLRVILKNVFSREEHRGIVLNEELSEEKFMERLSTIV